MVSEWRYCMWLRDPEYGSRGGDAYEVSQGLQCMKNVDTKAWSMK